MRLDEMFATRLHENMDDAAHSAALDQTGFWGQRGAGCVIMARSTGRFLIAHRSADVQEPNTWGTWGGAIDSSEAPADAVKREVHEETGYSGPIEIEPLYVFKSPTSSFRYFNFLAVVEDEFQPRLDWENQGFKWCEWGKWPRPLHFGLQGLLSDEPSVRVMKAACLAAGDRADKEADGLPVREAWNPFGKSERSREVTGVTDEPNGAVRLCADGVTFLIATKAGSTNVARNSTHPLVWQIFSADGALAARTEFRSSTEALTYIRSGKPLLGASAQTSFGAMFRRDKHIRIEIKHRTDMAVMIRANGVPIMIARVIGSKTDENGRLAYAWEIRQGSKPLVDHEFESPEAAIRAVRSGSVPFSGHR